MFQEIFSCKFSLVGKKVKSNHTEFTYSFKCSQANKDFIDLATIIEIDKNIIESCINLRKQHRIKLPDAIIAATALVHNMTLISRNTSDFKNIEGLKVLDPHTL